MKVDFRHFSLSLFSLLFLIACNNDEKPEYEDPEEEVEVQLNNIDAVSQALEEDPYNPGLYFTRANLYYDEGSYELALQDMQSAITLDSTVVDYYIVLSQLFIETGNAEKAILGMRKAIAIAPDDVTSYLLAGKYAYIVQEYQSAVDFLNQALVIDVTNPDAYFLKGAIYRDMGDTAKSISNFLTCVEQDPSYDEAFLQVALLYSYQKDPLAITYYNNALKSNQDNLFVYNGLGKYYMRQGQFKDAITAFREIIIRDMDAPETMYQIAECYLEMDSIDKAYLHFDMAIESDPLFVEAYYKRGYVALLKDDLKNARFNFEQALNIDDTYQPAIDALALVDEIEGKS